MNNYGVFYIREGVYTWSLITRDLQHAIERRDLLPKQTKPIILIGKFGNRDYTVKEVKKMEKYAG